MCDTVVLFIIQNIFLDLILLLIAFKLTLLHSRFTCFQ